MKNSRSAGKIFFFFFVIPTLSHLINHDMQEKIWESQEFINYMYMLYSRKIWQGIKFGRLAVYITTAKLKSVKISYSHIYVW